MVNVERGQPIGKAADLSKVSAIAMFGGQLTDPCLKSAPELKVVAGVFGGGYRNLAVDPIFERDIAIIDDQKINRPRQIYTGETKREV